MISFYGILPANIRYDKTLPDKAKLLYVEITAGLSYKGECKRDIEYYSRLLDLSPDRTARMLRMLVQNDYVVQTKVREAKGKNFEYYLSLPQQVIVHETQKGVLDQDSVVDATIEVVRKWNTLFKDVLKDGSELVRSDLLTATIAERLKKYSKDDILSAIENRHSFVSTSDWHQAHPSHMVNILHVIRSDEDLEKNLAMVQVEPKKDYAKETKVFTTKEDDINSLE